MTLMQRPKFTKPRVVVALLFVLSLSLLLASDSYWPAAVLGWLVLALAVSSALVLTFKSKTGNRVGRI
jgi:heme O synthase-like polyprenyltransferase